MDGIKSSKSEFTAGRPDCLPIIVHEIYKPNLKRYRSMTTEERKQAYIWLGDRIEILKRMRNDFAKDAGKRKKVKSIKI